MINKKVVLPLIVLLLTLMACQNNNPVPLQIIPTPYVETTITPAENPLSLSLDDYLAGNVGVAGFGGVVFCAYDLMGMDFQADQVSLYLWVLCQEYYVTDKNLDKGTGLSLPVAVYLEKGGDGYTITGHEVPLDGSEYGPSIQRLFPENLWPQIFGSEDDRYESYNQRAERLDNANEQSAKIYFLLNEGIQKWIWPEY